MNTYEYLSSNKGKKQRLHLFWAKAFPYINYLCHRSVITAVESIWDRESNHQVADTCYVRVVDSKFIYSIVRSIWTQLFSHFLHLDKYILTLRDEGHSSSTNPSAPLPLKYYWKIPKVESWGRDPRMLIILVLKVLLNNLFHSLAF